MYGSERTCIKRHRGRVVKVAATQNSLEHILKFRVDILY